MLGNVPQALTRAALGDPGLPPCILDVDLDQKPAATIAAPAVRNRGGLGGSTPVAVIGVVKHGGPLVAGHHRLVLGKKAILGMACGEGLTATAADGIDQW